MRRASFLILLALAYWMTATAAVHVFMQKRSLFEGWHNAEYAFERMLDRSAHRPFVYRALTPWMVNGIDAALPEAAKDRYQPAAKTMVERYAMNHESSYWTPELERKYMIAVVLMSLFAFGALFALRALTGAAFPEAPAIRDASPLLFGALLPLSFMNGGFLYDFTELFLMFVAFALAWSVRPIRLAVVVGLAVLNKETAALLVPLLSLVLWHRAPRATWLRTSALLAALAVGSVLYLRALYADSPGWTMYDHIRDNFDFWTTPGSWLASMTVYLPLLPMPRGLNLMIVLPLLVVLASAWHARAPVVRHLMIGSAAINLPLFFLFCWRDETRNLSMLYPALHLNVCAALIAAYGRRRHAASETAAATHSGVAVAKPS
jgi:hypothetical protein